MTRKPSKRGSRRGRGKIAKRRARRKVAQCLTKADGQQCPNAARARGLCNTCYHDARRAILQGETTWTELEDKGLAGRYRGRFRRALEATHDGNHGAQRYSRAARGKNRTKPIVAPKARASVKEGKAQGRAAGARKASGPQPQLAKRRSA